MKDHNEFHKILLMPESYIINRFKHEGDGSTDLWWSQVCALSDWERDIFDQVVLNHRFRSVTHKELPRAVRAVLAHYLEKAGPTIVDDEGTQVVARKVKGLECAV